MDTQKIIDQLTDLVLTYGPRLAGALFVFVIGLWVVKILTRGFSNLMDKRSFDDSLKPFLKGIFNMLLKVMLGISILTMLGIEMTSFVAILGAAGLAVGMALSGTLQNFAGGVMILIFKPFKPGDFIEAQGYAGVVKEIQIFNTIVRTGDNKTIIIPNGGLSTSSMVNYSTESTRRVDWTFGIAYGDDVDKAERVIRQLCDADSRILKDPEVFVAVSELADSSVNFVVRAWVESGNYWPVFFDMNKNIYITFDKEGLSIPFPQIDVHVNS